MTEIVVSQTIKIIIGIFVMVALIFGFSLYFSDTSDFFEGLSEDSPQPNVVDLSGYKQEPKTIENETVEVINQTIEKNTGHANLNFVPIKLK